jgi:hypothetical protein
MQDVKVLLAVLVVILGVGFRVELAPAKVQAEKDPVAAAVGKKLAQTKKAQRAAAAAAAGAAAGSGSDAVGGANSAEAKKKARAAGGDIDESTEKALRELEDHNDDVAKRLKDLPFAGGDDDDDEAPASE